MRQLSRNGRAISSPRPLSFRHGLSVSIDRGGCAHLLHLDFNPAPFFLDSPPLRSAGKRTGRAERPQPIRAFRHALFVYPQWQRPRLDVRSGQVDRMRSLPRAAGPSWAHPRVRTSLCRCPRRSCQGRLCRYPPPCRPPRKWPLGQRPTEEGLDEKPGLTPRLWRQAVRQSEGHQGPRCGERGQAARLLAPKRVVVGEVRPALPAMAPDPRLVTSLTPLRCRAARSLTYRKTADSQLVTHVGRAERRGPTAGGKENSCCICNARPGSCLGIGSPGHLQGQYCLLVLVPVPVLIESISAAPNVLSATGGNVTVVGDVENATACQMELLSKQSFPVTYPHDPKTCIGRSYSADVTVGANPGSTNRKVAFALLARNRSSSSVGRFYLLSRHRRLLEPLRLASPR